MKLNCSHDLKVLVYTLVIDYTHGMWLLALDLYMSERFVLSTWESLGIEHVTVNTFGYIYSLYQGGGGGKLGVI